MMSCQPSRTMVDTSCPGYKSQNFAREQIATGKIGIMPVLGGEEKEQFRRPMANQLNVHFSKTFGKEMYVLLNKLFKHSMNIILLKTIRLPLKLTDAPGS